VNSGMQDGAKIRIKGEVTNFIYLGFKERYSWWRRSYLHSSNKNSNKFNC